MMTRYCPVMVLIPSQILHLLNLTVLGVTFDPHLTSKDLVHIMMKSILHVFFNGWSAGTIAIIHFWPGPTEHKKSKRNTFKKANVYIR